VRWVLITGFVVAFHALTPLTTALAQDDLASRQRAALKDIRETAADICGTIEQRGQQSESEIAGKVQAKLNGVMSKVADLGIEGTGHLKSKEYQGVLQTELAATLKESANCRKDVFEKLMEKMLPTAPTEANPNPLFPKGTVLKTSREAALTLESELHAGSNSTIFLAKTRTNDTVVVKIFWHGLGPNSRSWQQFKNEQQAAERLKHENIIAILDTGIVGGYPFTVMEYFRGRSLKEWLETHDRIPGPDTLSVAIQIADAIDFAHSHGIVHRDIKPSNILIDSNPGGRVVLSDFGVARVFGAVQMQVTATTRSELVGSPAYLAPEALVGREISTKSDIYSFGVVLYEMIAGKSPFANSETVSALLNGKRNKNAPDIRGFRKDVPKSVALRLAQTLSLDPNKRPQSARAVLSGIEDAIKGL
jgi:eukaryotic-like serine/threonine-protein kinase